MLVVHMSPVFTEARRAEEGLRLQFQAVISCLMWLTWVLRAKLRFSARTASSLLWGGKQKSKQSLRKGVENSLSPELDMGTGIC